MSKSIEEPEVGETEHKNCCDPLLDPGRLCSQLSILEKLVDCRGDPEGFVWAEFEGLVLEDQSNYQRRDSVLDPRDTGDASRGVGSDFGRHTRQEPFDLGASWRQVGTCHRLAQIKAHHALTHSTDKV